MMFDSSAHTFVSVADLVPRTSGFTPSVWAIGMLTCAAIGGAVAVWGLQSRKAAASARRGRRSAVRARRFADRAVWLRAGAVWLIASLLWEGLWLAFPDVFDPPSAGYAAVLVADPPATGGALLLQDATP
jgi:hypothetical protein